jgi:diguanylate cyclase (GGDEF)-like protein/PAS domain S-box-containing protein
MMLALFVWSAAYALSISSLDPTAELWWNKLAYLGIVLVPVGWFVFTAEYTGTRGRFSRRQWHLLLVIPVVTLIMVASDGWHHLIWKDLVPTPMAGTPAVSDGFGVWFWVHTAYSYSLLGLGGAMLVRMAIRSRHVYRKQALVILIGCALPIAANVAFLTGLQPHRELDMTPFVLAVSSLVFALGLFRFRLLDLFVGLVPVARDAAVEGMADGVVVVDAAGRVADVNPAALAILGMPSARIIGRPAAELMIGPVSLGKLVDGPCPARAQAAVSDGDGRKYLDLLASTVGREGDAGRIVVVRDITGHRKAEQALRESEERYRTLFENATDFVFTLRKDGSVESANQAGLNMLGYSRAELSQLRLDELVAPEDADAVVGWLTAGSSVAQEGVHNLTLMAKDGRRVELETSVRNLTRDNEIVAVQGIARDVTERKEWETALRHQALHDNLTDLPNRTFLLERLEQAISLAQRVPAQHALAIIDLDRFKEVNDTYGHHFGDIVLRELSARFQTTMRSSDTIARLGGDEFAVFMQHSTADTAADGARRMLLALEEPVVVDGLQFQLQASAGIAIYPDHGSDAHSLLRRADVAMYVAKRSGESLRIYSQEEDPHSPARLFLLTRLREALREDAFTLHYQPIVDVKRGSLLAFEALARWEDAELGAVGPARFIPLLEETGLIMPFTLWVLEEVVRQIAEWAERGLEISVNFNLSARNLHDRQVLEAVQTLCLANGVKPSSLAIEVTEGSIMTDPARALETLRRLSDLGVSVAVDDFGTGYSSLAYLQRLPVTHLKIDRSFVHSMASDPGDAAIVRSTIGLGHDLGLTMVAEGVEDRAVWDLLSGLGCDAAQGYYIARPMPAEAVTTWLKELPLHLVGTSRKARAS